MAMEHDEAVAHASAAERRGMRRLCLDSYTLSEAAEILSPLTPVPVRIAALSRDGHLLAFEYEESCGSRSDATYLPRCVAVRDFFPAVHMTCMKVERDTQPPPFGAPGALPPRSASVGGIGWLRRWVVLLFEPLIRLEMRAETERHVRRLVRDEPAYFSIFVAGVLADLVGSLPQADPWRRTSLQPGTESAATGLRFGTWRDGTDLITRQHPDLASDMNLAALAEPLAPASTHLLAAAAAGFKSCKRAMRQLSDEALTPALLFDAAAAALRWAIHRRRTYLGHEDPFAIVTSVAWVTRAQLIVQGRSWDEARRVRLAAEDQVPEEAYLWLATLTPERRVGDDGSGFHGRTVHKEWPPKEDAP